MDVGQEEEALLRQTARRTPMGAFLRRFWYPVATALDLTDARPTKLIHLLSQTFVLFKDTSGRAALIPDRCPHEGSPMLMGAVNDHGITCLTHGWFFDTEYMCSVWGDDTVWAEGFPVRQHGGLYWAYLGEEPVPDLAPHDLLAEGGTRRITVVPDLPGHWLLDRESMQVPGTNAALWLVSPLDSDRTMAFGVEVSAEQAAPLDVAVVPAAQIDPDDSTPLAAQAKLAPTLDEALTYLRLSS